MIERQGRARGDVNPLGGPVSLAAWLACLALAVGLTLSARAGVWLETPRAAIDDVLGPARALAAAPFRATRAAFGDLSSHWRVHKQNERLRAENQELWAWYDVAQALLDKADRYEELLALRPVEDAPAVAARVVAETSGPFVRSRLLDAGASQGVAPGQAVISERGLVGRVVAVGRRGARVLLLTDLNSQIPVMVERTDDRAILAGDNTAMPRLQFLPREARVIRGDRIVTSGDGGHFPRGLIVGEAVNDRNERWRVRLFADDAPIDFVKVLQFAPVAAPEDDPAAETGPDVDAAPASAGAGTGSGAG